MNELKELVNSLFKISLFLLALSLFSCLCLLGAFCIMLAITGAFATFIGSVAFGMFGFFIIVFSFHLFAKGMDRI